MVHVIQSLNVNTNAVRHFLKGTWKVPVCMCSLFPLLWHPGKLKIYDICAALCVPIHKMKKHFSLACSVSESFKLALRKFREGGILHLRCVWERAEDFLVALYASHILLNSVRGLSRLTDFSFLFHFPLVYTYTYGKKSCHRQDSFSFFLSRNRLYCESLIFTHRIKRSYIGEIFMLLI